MKIHYSGYGVKTACGKRIKQSSNISSTSNKERVACAICKQAIKNPR